MKYRHSRVMHNGSKFKTLLILDNVRRQYGRGVYISPLQISLISGIRESSLRVRLRDFAVNWPKKGWSPLVERHFDGFSYSYRICWEGMERLQRFRTFQPYECRQWIAEIKLQERITGHLNGLTNTEVRQGLKKLQGVGV